MTLDKKLGVYICSGCKIGKCLAVEKLARKVSADDEVSICKTHASLCSVEGYECIRKDIEKEKPEGVLIAACSPREKTEIFDFAEPVQLERVNIRELV
ncbi:unnamed protein product, partial [marine sediment metagenome]